MTGWLWRNLCHRDLRGCHQLGEVGLRTFQSCPVSWYGDRHLPGESLPFGRLCVSFLGLGDQFYIASFSSSKDVAAAVGPHGVAGTVCPQGPLSDGSSSMAPQRSVVTNVGQSLSSSSSVTRVRGVGSLVAPGRDVGCRCSSAGSSSLYSSAHRCLSFMLGGGGGGGYFLDLTVPRVWLQEESLLHISVLEMRAVVLALAAFLPQLAGQAVVLMSDSTTVVA